MFFNAVSRRLNLWSPNLVRVFVMILQHLDPSSGIGIGSKCQMSVTWLKTVWGLSLSLSAYSVTALYWHSLDGAIISCWHAPWFLLDFDGIYLLAYLLITHALLWMDCMSSFYTRYRLCDLIGPFVLFLTATVADWFHWTFLKWKPGVTGWCNFKQWPALR